MNVTINPGVTPPPLPQFHLAMGHNLCQSHFGVDEHPYKLFDVMAPFWMNIYLRPLMFTRRFLGVKTPSSISKGPGGRGISGLGSLWAAQLKPASWRRSLASATKVSPRRFDSSRRPRVRRMADPKLKDHIKCPKMLLSLKCSPKQRNWHVLGLFASVWQWVVGSLSKGKTCPTAPISTTAQSPVPSSSCKVVPSKRQTVLVRSLHQKQHRGSQ